MVDVAKVRMFGQNIGTFVWDDSYRVARFEYDNDFVGKGIEPSPIMMPVQQGRIYSFGSLNWDTFNGLPGMLADSLPDTYGRALFDQWLTLTGRTTSNPVESLCFLGQRCMGALEFEPATGPSSDANMKFEIDTLIDVAREALSKKKDFGVNLDVDRKAAIAEILRLGTSAGGQRAKAIIAYNKKTGEVRSGQISAPEGFDYYLIKLDGVTAEAGFKETENFGRLEYSFSELVKNCGIDMTECSLIEENGRAHFLTKRFDRQRVHIGTDADGEVGVLFAHGGDHRIATVFLKIVFDAHFVQLAADEGRGFVQIPCQLGIHMQFAPDGDDVVLIDLEGDSHRGLLFMIVHCVYDTTNCGKTQAFARGVAQRSVNGTAGKSTLLPQGALPPAPLPGG